MSKTDLTPRPIGAPTRASEIVLRGARLLNRPGGGKVDILIRGERIAAIGEAGELSASLVRDVDGLWAMPGVIDAHVHPIHNETFATVGAAAPYGGVTTVLHHLYPMSGETAAAAVARGVEGSTKAAADFAFHLRLTPENLDAHLGELPIAGVVSSKVFLAHSDPSVVATLGDVYRVARRLAAADLTMIVHAEIGELVEGARVGQPPPQDLATFDSQRPASIEAAAVTAIATIAGMTHVQAYIAHVSSELALSAAVAARAAGVNIKVETCPHYLLLTRDAALGGLGRVAPPLRSSMDLVALRRGVALREVDVVASDHCGYSVARKPADDVAGAWNGLPGLETLLPLLLDAALSSNWLSPAAMVNLLCHGPAEVFGLPGKGRLSAGFDADVVLVDTEATYEVRHELMHDRSFYTPYEGQKLRGRVVEVIRRGETIVRENLLRSDSSGRPAVAMVRA